MGACLSAVAGRGGGEGRGRGACCGAGSGRKSGRGGAGHPWVPGETPSGRRSGVAAPGALSSGGRGEGRADAAD